MMLLIIPNNHVAFESFVSVFNLDIIPQDGRGPLIDRQGPAFGEACEPTSRALPLIRKSCLICVEMILWLMLETRISSLAKAITFWCPLKPFSRREGTERPRHFDYPIYDGSYVWVAFLICEFWQHSLSCHHERHQIPWSVLTACAGKAANVRTPQFPENVISWARFRVAGLFYGTVFTLFYVQTQEFSCSPPGQKAGPIKVNLLWSAKWYTVCCDPPNHSQAGHIQVCLCVHMCIWTKESQPQAP